MIPQESQTVERKESLSLWREVVETCAAFATAQGGKVFIGAADNGRVVGVQIGSGTLEDVANRISQNTAPRIVPGITTTTEEGKTGVFKQRLEVWNPGELPEGMTVEDLRHAHDSKPRNKLVADAFFLIRYIEQFGTGTGRMIEQCRQAGAPEPEFESRTGSFRIVFCKPVALEALLAELKLNGRQLKGVRATIERGRITRREYEELTATLTATAKRDLAELVDKGVLEKRGQGRSVSYVLAAQTMSRNVSRE